MLFKSLISKPSSIIIILYQISDHIFFDYNRIQQSRSPWPMLSKKKLKNKQQFFVQILYDGFNPMAVPKSLAIL